MDINLKDKLYAKLKEKNAAPAAAAARSLKSSMGTLKGMDFKRIMKNVAILGGAGLVVAGGIKGGEKAYGAITDPIKKSMGKKVMYKENPWLGEEDKKDVNKFYNTLYRFSPTMAMDPVTSGSFMKRVLEFKDLGVQSADVKTLSEVEKNVRQGKSEGILTTAFSPAALGDIAGVG